MQVLKLPKVGQGMEEGTVVEWRAAEGDQVAAEDVVVVFESDKATNEITADIDGILVERAVAEGETVPIGTELGRIEAVDEATAGAGTDEAEYPETADEADVGTATTVNDTDTVHATPAARRLAREHGLSTEHVAAVRDTQRVQPQDVRAVAEGGDDTGTTTVEPQDNSDETILGTPRAKVVAGDHGVTIEAVGAALEETRVREADVEAYIATGEANEAETGETSAPELVPSGRAERGPPTGKAHSIDETIGPMFERMAEVARNYASTTTIQRVDVTDLLALQDRLDTAWDDPVPTTALVVRAVADCLPDYPLLNAAVEDEDTVRTFEDVNIGIAVDASDRGLLVPTIYGADDLTLREAGQEVARLSTGASNGTLDTADLRNGTFTVSNAGGLGAYINTPMINPPQTAVLGICEAVEEPAIQDGEVVSRQRMHLCLTYDHRVVAGADAVGFLSAVRERLETPETLLS